MDALRRATEAEARIAELTSAAEEAESVIKDQTRVVHWMHMMEVFAEAWNSVQPGGAEKLIPAPLSAGLKAVMAYAGVKGDWEAKSE